jgi:hypothetical protein
MNVVDDYSREAIATEVDISYRRPDDRRAGIRADEGQKRRLPALPTPSGHSRGSPRCSDHL